MTARTRRALGTHGATKLDPDSVCRSLAAGGRMDEVYVLRLDQGLLAHGFGM